MAFVIEKTRDFRYPVSIPRIDERGNITTNKVMFRFKKLDADELLDYEKDDMDLSRFSEAFARAGGDRDLAMILLASDEQSTERGSRRATDKAAELMGILIGWEDVADADGPIEFDADNLVRFLRSEPPAYQAIKQAFRDANSGGAKAKNS